MPVDARDNPLAHTNVYRSAATIGAPAARRLYDATGEGIVCAVLSSGIDGSHPHFRRHATLDLPNPLKHTDFTDDDEGPLVDSFGQGTHVAGLIAGEMTSDDGPFLVRSRQRDADGSVIVETTDARAMTAIAPRAKLLSMRVIDSDGKGKVSTVIEALRAVQAINGQSGLRVQCAVLPLGYAYDTEWYACGMSPLCIEVDRLVRSGVVVVVAAGNTGYGTVKSLMGASTAAIETTINDPGNAELAITVGATHRDLPSQYGVSYFSSKGPTADGRLKPDLVAPGEKIASCAAGKFRKEAQVSDDGAAVYSEDSGTSMAAAHVAGAVTALLSARPDLVGRPDEVKDLILRTATDLNRQRTYQGHGLLNLMAALNDMTGSSNPRSNVPRSSMPSVSPRTQSAQRVPVNMALDASSRGPHRARLMCSYSHKDTVLWEELQTHLAPLQREGLVSSWYDGRIAAGSEWEAEIAREMERADIILLLVSASFVASDYCYNVEMRRALERHEAGTCRVIPVIARPADWSGTPFAKLKALPRDGRPVTQWQLQDEAWVDVAKGIRSALEDRM